ncbi:MULTISPECIES: hypothetical protein [Streptomyces]|uniref:Uncharacterized protein n=1 Tax=Streptomyces lasiicapitis TaxID=1923961 RepID=A0ABQ2LLI7_9ACTN|nr:MULTISPECIES: hypothetical protein [Streptomyces]QIB42845.1 hypothetical protein G3H79_06955 [Streptomyces aureoverticillatus]GGO39529.1 hypothetical protein GCM10012286_16300 [Streptomyces lasiicapitis]
MQGTPHIASTPHDGRWSPVPPARGEQHPARRPRAAEPRLPVFIDESGLRRRTLQGVALLVGCACVGYLLFVGAVVSGLREPVGTRPPSTNGPAPADRPDTDRSAPSAGGPRQ